MVVLGITGGVGSGKSRILYDMENKYGGHVIEADKLAHKLMEPGKKIYEAVVNKFGKDILMPEYPFSIDRQKLGQIVFSDREKLTLLNEITHPMVKEYILNDISMKKKEGKVKLYVIEAALLIQDGYKDICDEIWYIWVSREERIKRLMTSRGYTREKCISMMDSQENDRFYRKYANCTINNNLSYENSSKQLEVRLNKLFENVIIA